MTHLQSTVRWPITLSLLVTLSVTNLCPWLVAGREAALVADASPQRSSCCGKPTHACCGMVCCAAPAPKPDQLPTSSRRGDDRDQSVGIATLAKLMNLGSVAAASRLSGACVGPAWMVGPTLINLGIRLNT